MADRTVRVRVIADNSLFDSRMMRSGQLATTFGRQAAAAGTGTRGLAAGAAAASGRLTGVGSAARGGAAGLREGERAATLAGRGLTTVGTTGGRLPQVFNRIGSAARSGLGTARGATQSLLSSAKSLGTLLAGGAIIYGLADIVHQGNEYTGSLLKFSEVTRASGAVMAAAGREAQSLGSDLRLPTATAAEAADAMVELSKAGLAAPDAITAARGTLELAAAARTDIATAAKIEGDAMDQFAMKASEAGVVADTLANTANNTSGELIDLSYALKYVGPTAHSLGVDIEDASTAIGLLGKSGIIGETAGTTLRGMLVNLAKPTKQAKVGIHDLGLEAFDSQGNFKGLEYVIGQLHDAQEHMTQQQFTMAAAMAFGKPALSGATALAHQGAEAFELLSTQVKRTGGAADIAAAESKGLGGAMRGLGTQVKSVFLQLYLGIAPALEKITRGAAASVSGAIPAIKRGIRTAGDLWDIYGPTVEKKLEAGGSRIKSAAERIGEPIKSAVTSGIVTAVPLVVTSVDTIEKVLDNAGNAADPIIDGLHELLSSVTDGAGAMGVATGRVQAGIGLLGDASGILAPIGAIVGGIAHAFASLPGPIQLSLLAMIAMRPFRGQITALQNTVVGYGRSAVGAFNGVRGAMQTQQALAGQAGVSLGRWGSALAAVEARSPAIARMGNAFRTTAGNIQTAGGRAVGFRSALGGIGAAAGSGAVTGLKGLMGVLGGPWGLAIGGAMMLLDIYAKRQQEAAAAVAAHQERVSSLAKALSDSSGAINGNVRSTVVQTLADAKLKDGKTSLLDTMSKANVNANELTNAYLGQGGGIDALRAKLLAAADGQKSFATSGRNTYQVITPQGKAYQAAAAALGGMSGEFPEAIQRQKDLAAAAAGTGQATLDATNPTSRLKDAIATLALSTNDAETKANALHDALTLLSGGELDVQAAVANMNQAIADLNDSLDKPDKGKGYGKNIGDLSKSLILADGSLNTTTANGRTLMTQLTSLNASAAGAAQATYDLARANGEDAAPALKKAEGSMQSAWKAAVAAGKAFGLSGDDAKILAYKMGFIPSNLAVTLSTPGLPKATAELLYVQGLASHMPKGSKVTVSALTADAQKQLEDVGFKIHTLPGGRQMEITVADAAAQKKLDALIGKSLPKKTVGISADTRKAMADLGTVQRKIMATKGRSVTVSALTKTAESNLRDLGFKVTHLKNGQVSVSIPTGPPATAVGKIQAAINSLHGTSISNTITTYYKAGNQPTGGPTSGSFTFNKAQANGSVLDYYADGGMHENHVAQIAPAGGTIRMWAEPETWGESYIPLAPSKRGRSRKIAEETVRRLGGKGIAWNADGGISAFADGGFTYTPTDKASLGTTDARARFDDLVGKLRDAWSQYNEAVKDLNTVKKDKKSTKAQRTAAQKKVNAEYSDVKELDASLGLKSGSKAPTTLNLTAYQKQLTNSVAATDKWSKNLAKIGQRGGAEIQGLLQDMGAEGYSLVNLLAGASTKQFKDITSKLLKVGATAKGTLADFTAQVNAANTAGAAFQSNLLKLSSMGYGDLAAQLAAQGDDAAGAIAAAAVKDSASAKKANTAVSQNAGLLSGDDLTNAMTLLGVLRAKQGAGIADVIAAGLDWATVRTLAPKIGAQIKATAGSGPFVQQMAGQGVAMARGGIVPDSSYTVLSGERGTGGEAWIPLGAGNRARSTSLLSSVAGGFGFHLTPMRGGGTGQPVVQNITNQRSVTLNGARQSSAEQLHDVVRHMTFIG